MPRDIPLSEIRRLPRPKILWPNEHGAWGIFTTSFLAGWLTAPKLSLAPLLLLPAALGAFLTRYPIGLSCLTPAASFASLGGPHWQPLVIWVVLILFYLGRITSVRGKVARKKEEPGRYDKDHITFPAPFGLAHRSLW